MRDEGNSGSHRRLWSPSPPSGFRRRSPYSSLGLSQSSSTADSESDSGSSLRDTVSSSPDGDQSSSIDGSHVLAESIAGATSRRIFSPQESNACPSSTRGGASVRFSSSTLLSPPLRRDPEGSERVLRGIVDAPTELHEMCQTTNTTSGLDRLLADSNKEALAAQAEKVDIRGRTPMHLFAANSYLADEALPSNRFLVKFLLPACPSALLTRDDGGFVPFERGILEWIHASNSRRQMSGNARSTRFASFPHAADTLSKVWETTSSSVFTAVVGLAGRSVHKTPSGKSTRLSDIPDVEQNQSTDSGSCLKDDFYGAKTLSDGQGESDRQLYCAPDVRLDSSMSFSLTMLSLIVDKLDRMKSREVGSSQMSTSDDVEEVFEQLNPADIGATLVEIVASIPDLMKTILLICDDDEREQTLSTSIIRRVMLSPTSMGCWITAMLQNKDPKIARRPVQYLKQLSDILRLEEEQVVLRRKGSQITKCDDLAVKISRIEDFIPSLLALGDRGVEEASTTLIVGRVLDLMISRPFAASVVLCDIISLSITIIGFRMAVHELLVGSSPNVVLRRIYVANTGVFYFIIREIGKTVSLFLIAKRSRRYFLSFWNTIDITATILPLLATVSIRWHFAFLEVEAGLNDTSFLRALLAVTTGFLWLRVLSVLKAINQQLATFILAIIQITRDCLWFCLILLVLVISFSQIFYTLLAPETCAAQGGENNKECSNTEWLLRVYTITLGEFELDSYTSSFSILLVVFYSFMVTVVLLNVLIAVASDSYEKCLMRSQNLFGRARVMLIAELASLQGLLRKNELAQDDKPSSTHLYSIWRLSVSWSRGWSQGSVLFLGISLLVVVTWTLGEIVGYSKGEGDRKGNIAFSLASIIFNGVLYCGIMAFLASGAAGLPSKSNVGSSRWYDSWPQRAMASLLGSSQQASSESRGLYRTKHDEWNGRVHFLQQEMVRIADENAAKTQQQSKAFQSYVSASEARVRSELIVLEETLADEIKRMREDNEKTRQAIVEFSRLITSTREG